MSKDKRYSHYFKAKDNNGPYYFNTTTNTYELVTENYEGDTYYYDSTYCYLNENGEYYRTNGGLYLDLSYFNIPSIYLESTTIEGLFASLNLDDLVNGLFNSEASTPYEEVAQSESDATAQLDLPLLDDTVTGYIRAFLYGLQITSQYTAILVQPDYINAILRLIMGEESSIQFSYLDSIDYKNYSSLTIRADRSAYNFITATFASKQELDSSSAKFYATFNQEEGQYIMSNVTYIRTIADFEEEYGDVTEAIANQRLENLELCDSTGVPQIDGDHVKYTRYEFQEKAVLSDK